MISLHRCEEPRGIAQLSSTSEFSRAPWACYRNIISPNESKLCCNYKSNILKDKCFTFIHNCFSKMKIYHEGGEEMTHFLKNICHPSKGTGSKPSTHMGLTTVWYSSSRGSNILSSPYEHSMHVVHIYAGQTIIHIKK